MSIVAKGYHRGRAIPGSAEFGTSPEKGTNFVRVTFEIVDGEFKGGRVSWDGYFTDASSQRTVESLTHCGCVFPDNDVTNLAGIDANEVSLDVEHEEYDGKTYARVAWVNSLSRGIKAELKMGDTQKAAFKNSMMGKIALLRGTGSGGAGGAQQPAAGGGKIPF